MRFSVFVPGAANQRFPVLYFLSGLTCTDENFSTKAGAQRYAAEHGIALVIPDTSPRSVNLPGEDDSYDFGSGAGFYVDATVEPWRRHYRMYTYLPEELPRLVAQHFPVDTDRQGIFGHSMGGHGALVVALRNPDEFKSVSAFSPISSPMRCPWGQKALSGYLGNDESTWREYDATELIRMRGYDRPILVDQGMADEFLVEQLKPELLEAACREANVPLSLNRREGYDHSYYFIATFVGEHIAWHARALG
jgi:S-formylglutathione hydrolase